MKHKFLSIVYATSAALALLTTSSCSGIFSLPDAPDKESSEVAYQAANNQRYTLSGSFCMPNASAAPAEVNAAQTQANPERNAMPETSGLTYIVKAVNPDGHEESTISTDHKTYLLDNLTAGNWQITAYATNPSTGVTVMRSETESVSISAESPYASANLTMAPESSSGTIELSVNWDSDSGIGYCKWSLSGLVLPTGDGTSGPITIQAPNVSSGTYQLELNFYTSTDNFNDGAKPLYSCTEYVVVYPSLTTSQWTNGSAPHLTSGFNVTKQCVETFVYRRIYVSQTGNDTTGTGTSERPFATIEKAMNRLSEVATLNVTKDAISATTPWELHVIGCPTPPSGSISGNGLIVATNAIKFLKIVGDGDGAKIDANGKGRILYVYNSAKVSMQNIELTNGSSGSGSGVHVLSGGSFTMESGSITSCTTSGGGGGIYSLGNLTIQGGSISGNTANGGTGGGVLAMDGTLNITGGSIKGNTASSYGNNIIIDSSTSITNLPAGNSSFYDDNTSPANGRADAVCQASGHCFMRFNKPNATQNSIDSGINGFNDDATIYLGQTTDSADLTWQSNPNIAFSCTQNLTIKPTKDGRKATILNYNTSAGSNTYLIYYNANGKTLTLTNLILDGNSKKCGIAKISAGSMTATNCTFQNGGNVTNGAGINMGEGSYVTIESGTSITGNTANNKGGGIYCYKGNLTINGGAISNNTINSNSIYDGGIGIFTVGGSLTMTGGEISANNQTVTGYHGRGGGLRMNDGTIFTMSGGKITNNHNMGHGANIYTQNAQIELSGTAEISYGTTDTSTLSDSGADAIGGAMYLESGSTSLIMSGGEIFGNTAKGKRNACAGLWIVGGASFTMTGGRIYNNDNESWGESSLGGAIHFRTGGTFSISGSASIPSGVSGTTGAGKNDVYLLGTQITIADGLTADAPVATITPAAYPTGTDVQVLAGTTAQIANACTKFDVTPNTDGWYIDSTGYLKKGYIATSETIANVVSRLTGSNNTILITGPLNATRLATIATAVAGSTKNIELDLTPATISSPFYFSSSFTDCSKLLSVAFDGSKIYPRADAFKNCTNLQTVKITGSLDMANAGTSWSSSTFQGCTNIQTIDITECTSVNFSCGFVSSNIYTSLQEIRLGSGLTTLTLGNFGHSNFSSYVSGVLKYEGTYSDFFSKVTPTQQYTKLLDTTLIYCTEDGCGIGETAGGWQVLTIPPVIDPGA